MSAVKSELKELIRSLGYDVRRVQKAPDVADFLESRQIDVVLDVGAHLGQFAKTLRFRRYRGDIVSFEPVRQTFERLRQVASGDRGWEVRNLALGATAGRSTIQVSEATDFSSLVPQRPAARRFSAEARVMRTEDIDVTTLDDVIGPFSRRNVFLKVDTQGFERQVLAGGAGALAIIKGVQLELPIVRLYDGDWGFCEAVDYMRARGFVISQINPVSFFFAEDPVSLIEVDCVFRREGELDV